ncbi:hypothetical protein V1517DRAFT_315569 [Lipomyces orientalis]|uniref:Uncharacterized protein n=1 Tax=Lipomyces orientalis TaxID=1233043 RepID=A0ACC3TV78_9ASCO
MSSLATSPFPPSGLRLTPSTDAQAKSAPPQAFHLRLSEHALADLIASSDKDPSSVSLVLGKNMGIKIGKSAFYSISAIEEPSLVDVYSVRASGPTKTLTSAPLKYLGRVSHKLTVENHELDVSSSKLKSQNEAALREKESLRTTLLEPKSRGRSQYSTPSPRLAPSSPHLTGLAKPRQTLAPSSPKPGNVMRSLPMRMLHLLAVEEPSPVARLADRTKSSGDDIRAILAQYARTVVDNSGEEKFALTDTAYKELHVWEWRGYYPSDRDKVIAKATAAFERLGLPKDDPAWKMLVEPRLRNAAPAEDANSLQPSQADLIVPTLRLDDGPVPTPAGAPNEVPPVAGPGQSSTTAVKRVGGAILKTKQVAKKAKLADDKEKETARTEKDKKFTSGNSSPVPRSAGTKLQASNTSIGVSTTNKDTTLKVKKVKRPITPQLPIKPPSPMPLPANSSATKSGPKRTAESVDTASSDRDSHRPRTTSSSSSLPAANSNEERAGKRKSEAAPAEPSGQRSRSTSSSSPGTKSPPKPSPLGASPPITAADLEEEEERGRESRARRQREIEERRRKDETKEYGESELRRMAAMFKQSYDEYRRLYQDVRQYEISKAGSKNGKMVKKSSITNEVTYQSKRERLLTLHHKLESWKSTLWRAAPRFASA